jgi:hypothetical protein
MPTDPARAKLPVDMEHVDREDSMASPMEELFVEEEVDHRVDEERRVREWRTQQLRRLGVPRVLASVFADSVDWHDIAALVDRGCEPAVALEIVR